MGPRVDRAPDPRAVRSRAAALAAARELLVEHGLPGVTHVAVAARSGVGRTTLYRHWPEPSALLQDAIAELITDNQPELTGDLRADLLSLLGGSRRLLHDRTAERAMRAFIERSGVDPDYTRLKHSMYVSGTTVLRRILAEAQARGDLAADLDLDLAVDQLAGPLFFRRLMADREVTDGFVEDVVDAFLRLHGAG